MQACPRDLGGRRRPLSDDEVPEQHAPLLRLERHRVNHEEVIAKETYFLVTDTVGRQHLPPALRARDDHGGRVAW